MKPISRKIASLTLAALMMLTTACGGAASSTASSQAASQTGIFTPGTYSATTMGMHEMTVTVTVDANAITDIQLEHTETEGIGAPVAENMPKEIMELQGLGVDIVASATLTSEAILEGVTDCLKQAGATDEVIAEWQAKKPEVEAEEDAEYTADVVVIGAGGAGMSAAITAAQAGKNVIVLEKTGSMGGNTILSGGAMNAVDVGSEMAKAHDDSVALHIQQTYEGGDEQGNLELVTILCEQAWDGVEWMKELGMGFTGEVFTVTGGLWPRAQRPSDPEGTGFFKAFQSYLDENTTVTMLYNTTANELLVDENGAVCGVKATGKTGNTVTVNATNGVVLATGGFARNVELREKANEETQLWPTLDESIPSTNASGITGDGIIMAEAVGANLIQMGNIQLLPLGDPETGSLSGNIEHAVESRIFVNEQGERFVNEGGRRDEMTLALFEQSNTTMFIVMDSDTYPTGEELNNFGETMNSLVEAGRAYKADTLEELAEQMGVPAETLTATIEEYNRHCVGGDLEGQEDEFGRTLFSDVEGENDGINDAPFYAAKRVPTVHHTMGGVEINANAEVLNANGEVIPGLFAAGEVTGGIHGTNRLGGNALTDIIVFGRIAGASAAEYTR